LKSLINGKITQILRHVIQCYILADANWVNWW